MNIKAAIELITGLERDIEELLSGFEADTRLRVHDIAHRTIAFDAGDGSKRRFLEVRVDVKI